MDQQVEPQMPKRKTHKGLAKRVKVTGRGKVKRHKAFTGHLLSGRSSQRRRRLRRQQVVITADGKRILRALAQG